MIDYLDNDVAYLLGLIVARGEIVEQGRHSTISIEFPFRNLVVEGVSKSYNARDMILLSLDPVVQRIQNLDIKVEKIATQRSVFINLDLLTSGMIMRNIRLLLNDRTNYSEFEIPKQIFESNSVTIKKEFLRGFGDVAGHVRKSNRDRRGRHRVYLDVLNSNWQLPTQICELLQDHLEIPVQTITWGHPNIRDPNRRDYDQGNRRAWAREHQIKIYAESYKEIGFYLKHKQEILIELAEENEKNFDSPVKLCTPPKRIKKKAAPHPMENDESLPEELRGKHFDSYWQICDELGCYYGEKYTQV